MLADSAGFCILYRGMFTHRPCSVNGCGRSALTGKDACAAHFPDSAAYSAMIADLLRREKKLVDYDISGISLTDLDVAGASIQGCNLGGVSLQRVKLRKAFFHLVYCDFSAMTACDLTGSTLQNSVFGGSEMRDCIFEDCEIAQCNFLGVRFSRVSFNHSNLYASRFISGAFTDVGMKDCNLTRVRFGVKPSGVDFRSSNTNEADFEGGSS